MQLRMIGFITLKTEWVLDRKWGHLVLTARLEIRGQTQSWSQQEVKYQISTRPNLVIHRISAYEE